MDLGIEGRTAIVCAASRGLGRACAKALAREGVHLVINSRTAESLDATAAEIRALAPGVTVKTVPGSVTDPSVRVALVDAAPQADILVNNGGGPPLGDYHDWNRDVWLAAMDENFLAAVELIRLTADGMAERGFGRIVNITSAVVRVPTAPLGLSNAMRAALSNFVFGLVPLYSAKGVTLNNLLPGPFDTDRLQAAKAARGAAEINRVAGRVGDPDEFGATCAFLCSRHAGYINGQNIMLDGGLYPGNF
jgi:3-oxoacyl-[acyl-carrier protein] reductase